MKGSYTYDELAKALGIERVSAERLTRKKQWPRTKGNDGKARVLITLAEIEAQKASAARFHEKPAPPPKPETWRVHADLAEAKASLEAARDRLAAVEAAAERSEIDWRDRMEKSAADLAEAKAELAALKAARRGLIARIFG